MPTYEECPACGYKTYYHYKNYGYMCQRPSCSNFPDKNDFDED